MIRCFFPKSSWKESIPTLTQGPGRTSCGCRICTGRLLLSVQGEATPLCESKDAHISASTRSALAELTPLECENDLLEDNMEGCLTRHPASLIPLGWVDGILQPLPMVVHRSAHQDHGSGMKDMCHSDDEVH